MKERNLDAYAFDEIYQALQKGGLGLEALFQESSSDWLTARDWRVLEPDGQPAGRAQRGPQRPVEHPYQRSMADLL